MLGSLGESVRRDTLRDSAGDRGTLGECAETGTLGDGTGGETLVYGTGSCNGNVYPCTHTEE